MSQQHAHDHADRLAHDAEHRLTHEVPRLRSAIHAYPAAEHDQVGH